MNNDQDAPIFHFDQSLTLLTDEVTLGEKIQYLHMMLAQKYLAINRIAVALYDQQTDSLSTFIYSGEASDLQRYEAKLSDTPSLLEILELGKPRVVNDLSIFLGSHKTHNKIIASQDYLASYTLPMYCKGEFFGFIFFNASEKHFFNEENLRYLDLAGHLLSITIIHELTGLKTLQAAVNTVRDVTKHRDNETGSHLARMSRYSRLIAQELASEYELSDEYIEHLSLFAPLHDIGKVAIPDSILLKPGELNEEEFALMKTHTQRGSEIIDTMLSHFNIAHTEHVDMLRNIARYHHERMDGSGYLKGILGEDIPLEARIVAVADVFDALTSVRPYKPAWSNDDAIVALHELAESKLDRECVLALTRNRGKIEEIQRAFIDGGLN